MKRRWFTVGGVVEICVALAVTVVLFDLVLGNPAFAAWVLGFLVSGVFAVLGGESRSVAGLEWPQLLGLSYLAFAAGMGVWFSWQALTHPDDLERVLFSVALFGSALLIGFMGFDLVRGPKHFDLSETEPGPIFGSRSR